MTNIESCTFVGNGQDFLLNCRSDNKIATTVTASDCDFSGNDSLVLYGLGAISFTDCVFDSGRIEASLEYTFYNQGALTFTDCTLGNATFLNKDKVTIQKSSDPAGSIFGEGSMTMIVALAALAVAVVSLGITISSNKKKASAPEIDE